MKKRLIVALGAILFIVSLVSAQGEWLSNSEFQIWSKDIQKTYREKIGVGQITEIAQRPFNAIWVFMLGIDKGRAEVVAETFGINFVQRFPVEYVRIYIWNPYTQEKLALKTIYGQK